MFIYSVIGIALMFPMFWFAFRATKNANVGRRITHSEIKAKTIESWGVAILFGGILWPFTYFIVIPFLLTCYVVYRVFNWAIDKLEGEK